MRLTKISGGSAVIKDTALIFVEAHVSIKNVIQDAHTRYPPYLYTLVVYGSQNVGDICPLKIVALTKS